MSDTAVPPTKQSTGGAAIPEGPPPGPAAVPQRPETAASPSEWTAGRTAALVIGTLLVLASLGLLGGGGVALWADLTHRDGGYLTSDPHEFSTSGSALATERIDLGSPDVDWLYSSVMFGKVRIRATPGSPDSSLFVGIGPAADVDRYLSETSHTVISDFWTGRVAAVDGGALQSAPGTQDFWAASATGRGTQTVLWEPTSGPWSVVVMNADGRSGVDVSADLGATAPALLPVAVGALAAGMVFLVGGVLLIAGAIRHASRTRTQ